MQNIVLKNIRQYSELCNSITFVGSSSFKENLNKPISSDIDIIVLLKKLENLPNLIELLNFNFEYKFKIVQGWGLVTFEELKTNTIHLLVDTIDSYQRRNELFKRSAAKYAPLFGKPLSLYSSHFLITKYELLHDGDGIIKHYNDAKNDKFDILTWENEAESYKCISKKNIYASKIDQLIYIVFQCQRNILRFLNIDIAFSSNKENLELWKIKQLPRYDFLKEINDVKRKRKMLKEISNTEINILHSKTLKYLEEMITFIHLHNTSKKINS